jgi:Zn-dependent oligopeptidase
MLSAAQIKEAVLNGVSLEDDKRQRFNEIQQVSFEVDDTHYSSNDTEKRQANERVSFPSSDLSLSRS